MASSQSNDEKNRYQLLVESVQDYAIFLLDPSGFIQSWNIGAEKIKGYAANEIIGKHISIFYPPSDVINDKPQINYSNFNTSSLRHLTMLRMNSSHLPRTSCEHPQQASNSFSDFY